MKLDLDQYLEPDAVEERCGLILKDGTVIEVDNVADEPEKGFEIPAEKLIEYEDDLAGTWHTHPGEGKNLSARDYHGFLTWPKLSHYIIGNDGVAKYVVEDGVVLSAD